MNSPQPVVQVGAPGSQGVVEITDMLFTTVGPGAYRSLLDLNLNRFDTCEML